MRKARILIVDDDESTRRTLGLILGRKGYETVSAATGDEAFRKAKEGGVNAALIDIKLPDMEGIELLWPLREVQPDLAIIMVTAYASLETSIRALNEGAWAYVIKPLNVDELLAALERALERQRLTRENARLLETVQRELAERKRAEEEIRQLQRELADIPAREQRRIGQELHDNLGQQLTGAAMMAKSLERRARKRSFSDLAASMAELTDVILQAHNDVRLLAKGLCPVEVDRRGLMAALEGLVFSTARRSGVEFVFDCPGDVFLDDNRVSTHLYHIAQEAVANAVRHGEAKAITIALRTDDGRITLEVRDDGQGMEAEAEETPGLGLRIMRYRADIIGGRLEIRSHPGSGTAITCTIGAASRHG